MKPAILFDLRKVQQQADADFAKRCSKLTLRQYMVLEVLHQQGGSYAAAIIKASGIDRSTLSDMLQRMERDGLVTARPNPSDARAKALQLTAKGARLLRAAQPHAIAVGRETAKRMRATTAKPAMTKGRITPSGYAEVAIAA